MKIKTNYTERAFLNLKIGISKLRESGFIEFYFSDLEELEKGKLCHIIKKNSEYAIFFYSKNAFNTKYELLLNCFPINNIIAHSMDELDVLCKNDFFDNIEKSQFAIKKIVEKRNKQLLRIYAYQHIGANELNFHDFKTTYLQPHWHIYGVDKETINKCYIINHKEHRFQNTYYDFFLEAYADILGVGSSSIDFNTHSIILRKKKLSLSIDELDRNLITKTFVKWKDIWNTLASCFTNFEKSNQDRYLLFPKHQIMSNLNKLIKENKIPLSSNTIRRLFWLAKRIQNQAQLYDPISKEYWRTIHMGINGSIGFTHDFENETSTLKIAPRTFATLERIGCLDKFYFCLKNRKVFLPESEILEIRKIQEELFSTIQTLSNSDS